MTHTLARNTYDPHFARSARPIRSALAVGAAVLALACAFTAFSAKSAFAISRADVLARAQTRIDAPVPYSQSKYYAGYRTDCSGYVSSCWGTGTSWSTSSFYKVSYTIKSSQLLPGDAMLKKGYHVRLFYGWLDEAHTQYVAYESAYSQIAGCRVHSLAEDLKFGYVPTRYDKISGSISTRNVLKNSTFDSWQRGWDSTAQTPVWWGIEGPWGSTLVIHRQDTAHSSRNSLKLLNPSGDTGVFTELSQSVPVVANAPYLLTAFAKTSYAPAGVEMRLTYLNALGRSVAETGVAGDRVPLLAASWRMMSLLDTAPASAVRAVVTIRVAGATTTNTAGNGVRGSSVTLDDISLVRPQVAVTIKQNRTVCTNGTYVWLSGSVTPTSAIGVPVTIYVQKPGGSWAKLTTDTVNADGSGAAWGGRYGFTSGMPRGTYRFKASVSGFPGVLGATSSVASVTLK